MTVEADIRTNLIAVMTANLSGYNRIANPYQVENNPEILLKKAYGIGFGPAVNTQRTGSCDILWKEREIQLPFINQITTTDSNRDGFESLEDAIFADQLLLIKALELDPQLSEIVVHCTWTADDGLEYLETDRNKYFLLNNILTVEYTETLT